METETFTTEFGSITLYTLDTYIKEPFTRGEYFEKEELDAIRKYIPTDRNILEIGGHCGTTTVAMGHFTKEASNKIYVFEPQMNNYALLVKNIQQNHLEHKVESFRKGIFSFQGQTHMHEVDEDGPHRGEKVKSLVDEKKSVNLAGLCLGSGGEEVDVVRLDDVEELFNIENVGFIHCDAQGSENYIFYAGQQFLKKHRPVVLFEDATIYGHYLENIIHSTQSRPTEEASFNVVKFCTEELGYSQFIRGFMGGMNSLLIP